MKVHLIVFAALMAFAGSMTAQSQKGGKAEPYVEKLTGPAAKRHLENLSARHPGVFRKAAEIMRQRGWRDTGRVEVLRTNREVARKAAPLNPLYRYVEAGPSAANAEGEIVTWQWDDGNYATWEGTVYIQEYSTGTWMTVDVQVWMTEGAEWDIIWDYIVDGEDSPYIGPDIQNPVRGYDRPPKPLLLASLGGELDVLSEAIQLVNADWTKIRNKWEAWGACTAFGCAGAVYTCNRQNPTPQEKPDVVICGATACIGVGIGCLSSLR